MARLEQNSRRMGCALPRCFDGHQIGRIQSQHIDLPFVLFGHAGKTADEESPLSKRLDHSSRTVHPGHRVQHALPAIGDHTLGFLSVPAGTNGRRRSHDDDEAGLTCFERAGDHVLQDLDQLTFRHLGFNIHPKPTIDILLCGHHLPLTPFVLPDDLGLVRDHDFRVDDDWKIQRKEFSKQTRIGRIRWFLQTDKRVEQAADFHIVIRLRFDAHARQPVADAFVLFQSAIPSIASHHGIQRIHGALDEKEEPIVIEPPNMHFRRSERCFDTGQE